MDFYRKRTGFVGFMLLFFLFIPQFTYANSGQLYEVQPNLLNIRSEPALDSEVVGWLHKGDTVTAFKEEYGWVQTYYGGSEVWVAKHHLIPVHTDGQAHASNSPETAANNTITVTADGVWIRQGPSTAHAVIGSTNTGNQYALIQTEGDWHQIKLENGEDGWIASWLTDQPTDTSQPTEAEEAFAQTETAEADSGSSNLHGYTIVLDAGHGGHDPGAIGLGGVYEKNIVTSTANTVANYLRQAGAHVIETRSGDYYVPLDERVRISNSYATDAFISIHYDAYPVLTMQGNTSYYYSDSDYQLARALQESIAASTSLYNRGVMFGDFRVLRDTTAPAALLELGFITNSHDLNIVQTQDYQNTVAQAITNGLISYFH